MAKKAVTPTWWDRAIGVFSPTKAYRNLLAREVLQRAYEGASRSDGWKPKRGGASANVDHACDARELCIRARALVQSVPYCANALEVGVSARVGTGIVPVWEDAALAQRWAQWVPHADYDGLLDFYGLQVKAERARDQDGAVFIRKHIQKMGSIVPLKLQVLEMDYLDTQFSQARQDGTEIINGIEYNRRGHRVAYWLFERHPGDTGFWHLGRTGKSKRVPADEIIHLFNPARPGQQNGFSRFAPVIAKVRDLYTYGDAELQRKQLEARLGVLATLENGGSLPELPGEKSGKQQGVVDLGEMAGGGIVALPPGVSNPTFIEPKAVPGFTSYMKEGWKEVAAGYRIPYELMTGDLSEVNFSSSRMRQNQFKREVEMEQWAITIPLLCAPVARWFLQALDLVAPVPAGAQMPDWTTPKWASPNPVQDVASDVGAVKGGMQSLSETIRQRGYDPETVFTELKQDLERLQADGTLPLLAALWGAQNPLDLVASVGEKAKD